MSDIARGLARGLTADYLGSPVDLATVITNLGLAGGGYIGHKLGLLDSPPDLIDPKNVPFSSDWLARGTPLEDTGSAAFTAGRFTGNLAPGMPKLASGMAASQPHGQLNAIVWHGSPHKFDKFDSSKIGTGEGAQAYGHGLYVAENSKVATDYATKLADFSYKGRPLSAISGDEGSIAMQLASDMSSGKSFADAKSELLKYLKDNDSKTLYAIAKAIKPGDISKAGNLYKIDLPDDAIARMLDWDKPLSQQAPEVLAALQKSRNKTVKEAIAKMNEPGQYSGELMDGAGLVRLLSMNTSGRQIAPQASQVIQKAGIPGIRYLDGASRSAGEGTRNFVIFPGNEHLLTILERNGQPLPLQTGLGAPR